MQAYRQNSIIQWARSRGILDSGNIPGKGTVAGQHEKTLEEVSELTQAITEKNKRDIKDAVGDIYVTLVIQAEMQGLSMAECIDYAYDTISKRKGSMVNGQFMKEGA